MELMPRLRRISIGNMLDAAFRLYRQHSPTFIRIVALLQLRDPQALQRVTTRPPVLAPVAGPLAIFPFAQLLSIVRSLAGHVQVQCRAENRSKRPWRIIVLALMLVLGAWCVVLPQAYAQSQPPDLATYTGWVREAFAAAQRSDRLGLEDAATRLVATSSVRLSGAATITVDNGWLRDALQSAEPDLSAIAARLGAIIDALAQPPSAAPADARERLQRMLDQPPFKQPDAPQTPSWLSEFFDWLGRVLENAFRPLGRISPTGGRTVAWVIAIIGAALLAGVLIYLLRGLRRGVVAGAQADDADPAANLTAKNALDQAGGMARGGDYRTAVRYLYISALLWLDERDILRYDRALTNREYLERVRDNPALREHMTPIVETFDRVWYGHLPIDAEAFAAYQRQVDELRRDGVKG